MGSVTKSGNLVDGLGECRTRQEYSPLETCSRSWDCIRVKVPVEEEGAEKAQTTVQSLVCLPWVECPGQEGEGKVRMFSLDLEKAEEPEIKLEHLFDHQKAREFQKNI
ncbi:hypothetical protein KIN20_027173 [Parelaphostrongylus tenuis]|uniref:Uncharacterized protein n=1 Tax=Parelaphostrongylus tenuis TaxID=148309 RepID=A0AAD5QZ28_PARTN|nr:hypothetical protein KIN20_027173 [Parelaphostrongylus tenuis]